MWLLILFFKMNLLKRAFSKKPQPQIMSDDFEPNFLEDLRDEKLLSSALNSVKNVNARFAYECNGSIYTGTLLTYCLHRRFTSDVETHVYFTEWSLLLLQNGAELIDQRDDTDYRCSCLRLALYGDTKFSYKGIAPVLLLETSLFERIDTWQCLYRHMDYKLFRFAQDHIDKFNFLCETVVNFEKQCTDLWLNNEHQLLEQKVAFAKAYNENISWMPPLRLTNEDKSKYFELLYSVPVVDAVSILLKRVEALEKELAELKIRPAVFYGEELDEVKEHYSLLEKQNQSVQDNSASQSEQPL